MFKCTTLTIVVISSISSIGSQSISTSLKDTQIPPLSGNKFWQDQNISLIRDRSNGTSIGGGTTVRLNWVSSLRIKDEIFNTNQMEDLHEIYTNIETFYSHRTLSETSYSGLTAKLHTMVYDDTLKHRHDKFLELKQSFGPHIDNELCVRQLEQLTRRANRMEVEKFSSKDMNLYHLLDTYGKFSSGLIVGGFVWVGMYDNCLSFKIHAPEGSEPTRYCWASLRQADWPRGSALADVLALKLGLCLPRVCDSLPYKNKYQLIQTLVEFNHNGLMQGGQVNLSNLYCLPDEDSPMRIWWKSPGSLRAGVVLATWLAVLVYSTIKHELANRSKRSPAPSGDCSKRLGSTILETKTRDNVATDPYHKIYQMLSIIHNLRLLFDTTKVSSLLSSHQNGIKAPGANQSEQNREPIANGNNKLVDLSCLDGIKVICMTYVIMGHVLMSITSIMKNGGELTSTISPAFFLANMMPAFAVNSFFTITGLLTCYLLFKQNQSRSLVASRLKWLAFVVYRYLRIMPMYALVVLYCKYLARFAGSGPFWDYGSSSLAPRRQCEHESWLWVLLFGANFKPPLEHCIPSAWYLANDFQFFIVTPVFVATLHRSPALGRKLLYLCIAAGYSAGFLSILLADASDMRPIARFMPHGFKTYVTFLSASYTRPYYRIPPYLCGLLFGHSLFTYETEIAGQKAALEMSPALGRGQERPGWSNWFLKHGFKMSATFMAACACTPTLGGQLPFNKPCAKLAVAIFMSSYHILFALAVGFYILLASTGHGNRFVNRCLSAPFWKPLARLSLCVVLINIEVINYIVQTQKQTIYLDFFVQTAYNLLGIVATYLSAIVVCVLFEAPIRAVLNQCFLYMVADKLSPKSKLN